MQDRREALPAFVYSDTAFEEQLGEREKRPLTVMENGARYTGEWAKTKNIRCGQGV